MTPQPLAVEVGQVYRDVDRGRLLRVLFVAHPIVHGVERATAACYATGKLTTIAVDRLQNPVRYELVPQEGGPLVPGEATKTQRYIYLPEPVRGDGPFAATVAEAGTHEAWTNPKGALFVIATNGKLLGIKPGEYRDAGGVEGEVVDAEVLA